MYIIESSADNICKKQGGDIVSEKTKIALTGCVVGLLNGFFGSGGGVIAVPMLRSCGFEQRSAHACSLAVTLPLSLVSVIIYAS